jgi:phospholipid/cholesterol/gamma-HCH transport system permease protein
VNQTVVISFLAVYMINLFITQIYLQIVPAKGL